ncbi:XAC2610-related protein [Pedobacter mucosus]|uniref:XAC2610-related protein n=1 Tax=Pedobacter mucosus TaxID=2895286 RepID=UPI001EE462C9|nr:hypothetical protein [Pedobacter mucosus]UKT62538.1 hypothetical protein LOK61_12295 [Pedobacter mucosus]
MKIQSVICGLILLSLSVNAQYKFLANNASDKYKAKIFVQDCENTICSGKATIILYDKISDQEMQTFHSEDLSFSLTEKQNAKIGWLDLGKYQTPLIFGDFNFDGLEDIAIRNGANGAYSSPSYDVYLSSSNNKFTLNEDLSKIASENLGMFEIDKKTKLITISQKNGCCFQKHTSYKFDSKKGLSEVSSVIEDTSIGDDVTVITQKVENGKIKRSVQKFKTKDYYEQ